MCVREEGSMLIISRAKLHKAHMIGFAERLSMRVSICADK